MGITLTMGAPLQERRRLTELSDTVIPERPPTDLVVVSYRPVMDFHLNYD